MKIFSKVSMIFLIAFFVLGMSGTTALAATAVNLGTAGNFAVIGGSTITNTGSTVVNGDLGLSPGTSVTGFPPGTVSGTQHVTDSTAAQAQTDLVAAYNSAIGQTVTTTVSGDLGGLTLTPGVYNSASSLGLTGTLTLDGQGNPDAVFIFQVGSALTTASGSTVNLINSAQACNVFWQVGSSATLGTNSTFAGSLLVFTSITATTGATINGRVLVRNGAVTLDVNSVTRPTCAAVVVPPPAPTPATLHVIKEVINNNGGIATASSFNLHVKLSGTDVSGSPAVGVTTPGRSYTLSAGTYVVSEDANTAYTQSFSGACDASGNVTLAAGADVICMITNDDTSPLPGVFTILHVIKHVVNDNGGTATASSFVLHVKAPGIPVSTDVVGSPAAGAEAPGTTYALTTSTYNVSENTNSSYTQSFSGDCDASGNVTFVSTGETKTCMITNNDIAAVVVPPAPTPTSTPSLPNTGFAPAGESTTQSIVLLVALVTLASTLLVVGFRKSRI